MCKGGERGSGHGLQGKYLFEIVDGSLPFLLHVFHFLKLGFAGLQCGLGVVLLFLRFLELGLDVILVSPRVTDIVIQLLDLFFGRLPHRCMQLGQ